MSAAASAAVRLAAKAKEEGEEEEDDDIIVALTRSLKDLSANDAASAVKKTQTNAGLPASQRAALLFRACLSDPKKIHLAVKEPKFISSMKLLATGTDAPAAGPAQKELIQAMEIVTSQAEEAMKVVPLILQTLYDEDILSEEAIVSWFEGTGGNPGVKAKAKIFVDWLKTAEEDDDDDDSD
jgi:hypothetical protein